MPGELDHAEGGVLGLEVRQGEQEPDREREARVREGRADAPSRWPSRHVPTIARTSGSATVAFTTAPRASTPTAEQLSSADHQGEPAGDGERHDQVVVAARDRI